MGKDCLDGLSWLLGESGWSTRRRQVRYCDWFLSEFERNGCMYDKVLNTTVHPRVPPSVVSSTDDDDDPHSKGDV